MLLDISLVYIPETMEHIFFHEYSAISHMSLKYHVLVHMTKG